METESTKKALLIYRLTFGNIIAQKDHQPELLQLDQGVRKEISDGTNNYYLLLRGIKVNRKIYQPTEIEAELDIMQATTGTGNTKESTVPKFGDVRGLLLQRKVTLDILEAEKTSNELEHRPLCNIASNCYVYEMTPMLKNDTTGTKMYVKLSIFSMDKLMTLNKYSKAYVARKLGSEILQPESLNFGTISEGVPLIESDIDNQRHLTYTVGDKRLEFIQPYLVQYNESFYDFMVRTSNRCGEFLYFEDGRLVLGLPDSGEAVTITDFDTVTVQETSSDPVTVGPYARDSVKDGIGAVKGSDDANKVTEDSGTDKSKETIMDLNISAIAREATGFPKDAFPQHTSSNAEIAQDDYIFPLYMGMFTNRKRELNYDGTPAQTALARSLQFSKVLLANEINGPLGVAVPLIIDSVVGEGIPTMLADLNVFTTNAAKGKRYLEVLKDKAEQIDEQKGVQFGTANAEGWTTLSYYRDILQHEEAQQRKIIRIDMGTAFIPVRLGQKIRINGLDDVYVIIQIQQNSEEAWTRNYDRYGMVADDKFTGKRSLVIYAIPGYGTERNQFIPPVHPVPIIRKAGPQTAFVTDNEDPKFQGRVRVAFPWQSLGGMERAELEKVSQNLKLVENTLDELEAEKKKALSQATKNSEFAEDLKKYVKATQEERERLLQPRKDKLADLGKDKDAKREQIEAEDAEREQIEAEISDMEAAAEEHDKKKGDEEYKNLEKDNTIICKYHKAYKEAHKRYHATMAELDRVGKDKEWKEKKCKELVEYIEKEVNAMATPWVRVVTPMATPGGGTFFRPRVGDEVLVNFENDNVERPYVMGSVFSKNNLTPDEKMYRQRGPELQGKDVSIAMMSPNGHHISFTDPVGGTNFVTNLISPGLGLWGTIVGASFTNQLPSAKDLAGGIHIGDRYGLYEIDMKSHKRSIEINSPFGTVSINAFSGITISAPNGNVTIKGKNINLEAGNKVNILSGLNIDDPGIGDPEGAANQAGKIFTDIFAEIIPTEITKYLFSSIVDLSYIRHVVEVIVRPVDGTLKLKSKRYLMLEAGKGNAAIRSNRYKSKPTDMLQEDFFQAMQTCVKYISEKIDLFYDTYETLWTDGNQKRNVYMQKARRVLKDMKEPNLIKKALDSGEWEDDMIGVQDFKDYFDKTGFLYSFDRKTRDVTDKAEVKFEYLKDSADAYCQSAIKMFNFVKTFPKILGTPKLDLGLFDWMAPKCEEALTEMNKKTEWLQSWNRIFREGDEQVLFFHPYPSPKADMFAMQNKAFCKRKVLLAFIYYLCQDPRTVKGKLLTCGLNIDQVFKSEYLRQEYYWNRTVLSFDRDKRVQNNYARKLYDSVVGLILKNVKSFAAPLDSDIWKDKYEGQILFSDRENSTLNFQGEGIQEENNLNIGSLDNLKKMLMAVK